MVFVNCFKNGKYEKYTTYYKKAVEIVKITNVNITSFLSIYENMQPIKVYKVTYNQLF